MTITEYIKVYFNDNQRQFADYVGVLPQQVTQWINKKFIIIDDTLYSPRREIKAQTRADRQ